MERIRRAGPGDVRAVTAVVRGAFQRHVPVVGGLPEPMDVEYGPRIEAGEVEVLDHDGRIVAVLVTQVEPEALVVETIAVSPDMQRHGLGGKLLQHAETMAERQGKPAVRLYTNAKMIENQAFYAHRGYEVTRRAEEKGFERVFMMKRIA